MFVRALVDGQPADPSDVVFAVGGFTGTRSFTFTKENLGVGPHSIQIQWLVDSGGTAYIGDRTLSLTYWKRQVPDLSKPFFSLKPVIGKRNVLVILWDPHRPTDPAPSKSAVENLIFGPKPSVSDYFSENSDGRFKLESAGVLGWYNADKPADHYWGTCRQPSDQEDLSEDRNNNCKLDPGEDLNSNGKLDGPDGILQPDEDVNGNGRLDYDLDGDGWIHGHTEKWAEAIRKADVEFNFKNYDINNDNYLSPDELTVLIVIPQNSPFGTQRGVVGREYPTVEPLIVDGVKIDTMVEAYIGSPPSLGTVAHELSHILMGTGDMYFNIFYPYAAGAYSLMDQHWNNPHLDPFHKLRSGWVVPKIITSDGWYKISDIETHNEVYILYDPVRSDKEYYIVENRWPGSSYDSKLPDSGLAVWHIIEYPGIFDTLPAPAGVDAAEWAKVTGWSRRAIRMIRPIYGTPFNDGKALWDGSEPETGYDLLSVDPNPDHVTLKWVDGTPSGFSIQSIPVSSSEMEVYISSKFKVLPVVESSTGKGIVYFDSSAGSIEDLKAVSVSDIPKPPPLGTTFDYGLFRFNITSIPTGGSVTETLTFPANLPANTKYWKYGATPTNPTPHWYYIPSIVNGNKLIITLTDGGLGDDDLTANGRIKDDGGPSISTVMGDLNGNGISADAGDLVLMKRASIGEIQVDSRYDLNNNGQLADAGDLVLMKRASIGEINL